MIIGIGIDIVDITRFAAALSRAPNLLQRLFSERERASVSPSPAAAFSGTTTDQRQIRSLAARFAAKEAVIKALGGGPRTNGATWHDIEVLTNASGAPGIVVSGALATRARESGAERWHVSLSHDGSLAIALAVAEDRCGPKPMPPLASVAGPLQGCYGGRVTSIIEQIEAARIVPVVAVDGAEEGVNLAKALIAGGLPVAEITLRLPGAMEAIRAVAAQFPEMLVGAGTVINEQQLVEAVEAGAKFIVSPGTFEPVIRKAQELGVPILPGTATPSDVMRALELGVDVVKLFPAGVVGGPGAIKAFSGPFPQVRFMPTGGVTTGNLAEYLSLPAVVGVGGTWMVDRGLVTSGKFDEITKLTKEAVAAAETIRPAK